MTPPRALRSSVVAMARPRRPAAEIAAVAEAATKIHEQTGQSSAQALGREISRQVLALLLLEPLDDFQPIGASAAKDPIWKLAFGEGFGAVDQLAVLYRDRMLAHFGAALVVEFQQRVQRRIAAEQVQSLLEERYARQLRSLALRSNGSQTAPVL